jgi:hypothetical protein
MVHGLRQARALPAVAIGLAAPVVDEEIVERDAVAGGVDPRIDDVRPDRLYTRFFWFYLALGLVVL